MSGLTHRSLFLQSPISNFSSAKRGNSAVPAALWAGSANVRPRFAACQIAALAAIAAITVQFHDIGGKKRFSRK